MHRERSGTLFFSGFANTDRNALALESIPCTAGYLVTGRLVQIFTSSDELAQQVSEWLDWAGVDVVIGTSSLSDLSTVGRSLNSGTSRYDITTIRRVSIAPLQLYQDGGTDCVTLTVDTPDREPGRQQFYLNIKSEGGWFIWEELQAVTIKSTMTEDVFFQVIENLA